MIVQAIGLLDDLDKELNTYAMRIREWYGWHFPELTKIIQDNIIYAKAVKLMGDRSNAAKLDFSEILPEEIETELKEAAVISMGTEINDLDLMNIEDLCDQVLNLAEYRAQLYDYLKSRMNTVTPNLTALVGELVGARLIAHGGSLLNLSKQPGSTVQILGAEKALFRALKTKHSTPKYGLIYHASLVGQAAPKHKGKISSSAKGKPKIEVYDKDRKKGTGLITPAKAYNPAADSLLGQTTDVTALEEQDNVANKKKKVEAEPPQAEEAAEAPTTEGKKEKKKKKKKADKEAVLPTIENEHEGEEPMEKEKEKKKKKKHRTEDDGENVEVGEKKKKRKHAEQEESGVQTKKEKKKGED
ncbi:Nucleolar protein 58 [Hibiscus syriacus]|uniref:Nucleolar protein 58 n=1 Tax=Hibiscus syriacus TaxID=106335 RepID=A0A6A2YL85_HIBSY|nr:Nucleolar protein 58 [Hibiscus syriacus]